MDKNTDKAKRAFRMIRYYRQRVGLNGCIKYILCKTQIDHDDFLIWFYEKYLKDVNWSDKSFLKRELGDWYYGVTGRNQTYIDNPISYNDWIQWIKLYDLDDEKKMLADKYLMREWVANKVGKEYLVPLIGVWDEFDAINFDNLPEKFVLKCNHGSGMNLIVKDKCEINYNEERKKFIKWMSLDFSLFFGHD